MSDPSRVVEKQRPYRAETAPSSNDPADTTFSYLEIAGLVVGDLLAAHPEVDGDDEEVVDAILVSFSVERLRALVLAHLQA